MNASTALGLLEYLGIYTHFRRAATSSDGVHAMMQVPLGQVALPIDRSKVVIAPPSTMDDDADDGLADTHDGEEENEPKPLGQEQLLARVHNTMRKKAVASIFRVPEHSKRTKPPGGQRATQVLRGN